MDSIARFKDKLISLRIKELKDILGQLGISKQGKKQDLVDRIIAVLFDEQAKKILTKKKTASGEEIAKLVNDAYRKMQASGGNSLASKGQDSSDGSSVKVNGRSNDPSQCDRKVRCPCGSSLGTDSLIKCEDKRCDVWQHIQCVIIPERPMEVDPPLPSNFFCELCRLNRADPFWLTVSHSLFPVKLITKSPPTDGSNPLQSIEKTFQITRGDKDLFVKPEYEVQAWCMLLNDKVQFRMQWPLHTELQVNGMPIRAINRPGQQLLGSNGRDDGPIITPCTKDGINKISLTGCDARTFCLGVRIVKRQTVPQVLKLIPQEEEGERFDDALARVRRCVGGGNEADNADSDSDIEVVADFITVNLRCPMSGLRMKRAGRFKPCAHMRCFDLEVFVELNQRSKKWQCPICLKNYSLENIIIDPYFNRIISKMRDCSEDVTEVEVKPDGSWRVKCKTESERRELQDLVDWHLPDSNLCSEATEVNQNSQTMMQVKLEDSFGSFNGMNLEMGKNPSDPWESSRPVDMETSGNRFEEKFLGLGSHSQSVFPMSNSVTGSGRDEGRSVNQDGCGMFNFSNNGIDLDSTCLNIDSPMRNSGRNLTTPAGIDDVIVLSDSDEENVVLISSGSAYEKSQTDDRMNFALPPSTGISDSFLPDNTAVNGGMSSLNLCIGNDEDFGMHLWQSSLEPHGGQGFQLFTTDADVATLGDLQHNPNADLSVDGYISGNNGNVMCSTNPVLDPCFGQTHTNNIHDGFSVYPYPFDGDDPSLQIFLPERPCDDVAASHLNSRADASSNVMRSDDWISLKLGDGVGGTSRSHEIPSSTSNGFGKTHEMASGNEFYLSEQLMHSDGIHSNRFNETAPFVTTTTTTTSTVQMPSVEASLIAEPNERSSEKAGNRWRSDNPFSFPRQKRSVRPRLHLSIDSGSE